MYEIYEDNTTYAEGGLAGNAEDDEYPVMDNGLDHVVPTPEVNDNYVNASVMFPIGNSYPRTEGYLKKKICRWEYRWKDKQ